MADLTDLAKLFISANSGANAAIAAEDPYAQFKQAPDVATQLAIQAAGTGRFKTRDLIASGLISGLISGATEGLSQDYQGRARKAYNDVLLGAASGQNVAQPDVLSPNLFRAAKEQADLFKVQSAFAQAEQAQKLENEKALIEAKANADLQNKLAELAVTDPRAAKRLGLMTSGGGIAAAPTGAAQTAQQPIAELSDAEQYNQLLEQTDDPALARSIIERKSAKDDKRIEKIADYTSTQRDELAAAKQRLSELASTLNDVGQTGGSLIERAGRSVNVGLGSLVGNEAATNRASARQDLESQAVDAAGQVRKMFPGPTSEKEFAKYLQVVPGTDKLPEANKRWLERLSRVTDIAQQRLDIIEEAGNRGLTLAESKNLYDKIDRAIPLFKDGELNPDRASLDITAIPYEELISGKIDIKQLTQSKPQAQTEAAPSATAAPETSSEAMAQDLNKTSLMEDIGKGATIGVGNAADTALFGVPRKLAAGARALYQEGRDLFGVGDNLSLGENYAFEKSIVDAGFKEGEKQAPISAALGDIGGAIVSPINKLAPVQAITKAKGIAGVAGRAATFAGIGAAQKAGKGETPTLEDAQNTALLSVGLDSVVKGASKLAPLAKDTFNRLTGISSADYRAVAKRMGKTEILKTKIAFNRAFDILKKEQGVGVTDLVNTNENMLQRFVSKAQASIATRQNEIDDIVKAADQVLKKEGKGVVVNNRNVKRMAAKGLAANESKVLAESNEIIGKFAEKNKDFKYGSLLSSVHKELKALNPYYKVDPAYKDAVTAVGDDFRAALQSTVDRLVTQGKLPAEYLTRIKKLNLESRDLINLQRAYAKGLPAAMAEDLIGVAQRAGYTTGGASLQGARNMGEALGGQQGATAATLAAAVAASKALGRPVAYFLAENNLAQALSDPRARTAITAALNATSEQPPLPEFSAEQFAPDTERTLGLFGVQKKKVTGEPMAKNTPADDLVKAVIAQESGGNKKAVSSVGAQGLMQLMPATGKELFQKSGLPGEYDPFDPEQNVKLGSMYLQQLLTQFNGDPELALTAYHSGPGRVQRLLKITKGNSLADIKPLLGPVGQKYAESVLRRLQKLKNSPIKV